MMPRILTLALILLAIAPAAAAQERAPQNDSMVHMDLSQATPRYIPDEVVLVPGATLQLMLFGKGPSHSITLDSGSAEAAVAPGEQDGYYERVAQLQAPAATGDYPFHDKASGARGVLRVRLAAAEPAQIGVRENGYDLHFSPDRIEVAAGSTVTFRANQSFAHTLTSASGAWMEVALSPGQSGSFVAPATPGEYPFYCRYHKDGGMTGVLVVTAASASAPTPTQSTKSVPGVALPMLALAAALALVIRRRP